MAQDFKKDVIDPQIQESRAAAVKVKGGIMLFLAGHSASQPRPDTDLGNFHVQFIAVFEKIANTLAKAGGNLDDIVSMSIFDITAEGSTGSRVNVLCPGTQI